MIQKNTRKENTFITKSQSSNLSLVSFITTQTNHKHLHIVKFTISGGKFKTNTISTFSLSQSSFSTFKYQSDAKVLFCIDKTFRIQSVSNLIRSCLYNRTMISVNCFNLPRVIPSMLTDFIKIIIIASERTQHSDGYGMDSYIVYTWWFCTVELGSSVMRREPSTNKLLQKVNLCSESNFLKGCKSVTLQHHPA